MRPGEGFGGRLLIAVLGLVGATLLLAVATVPLEPREQALLAAASFLVFLVANRFRSRAISVFLVVFSLAVSLRYIVWRMTETLQFDGLLELVLGGLLALAELYAITVLVLGYVQTLWPLQRKPAPLPGDDALWPTVDVYIPTYNEPMSVVRATVLGCIAMDWPRDKLRVYLLDDGRREEFRLFAEAVGVGYIARGDNAHAKAGNLNNALRQTEGEHIAVFDSDHIPTRAFLQMTVGWLVREPRMAMVQTPHHFYSPDPFQRNLTAGTRVPSEGNMFYGLVQDGNDHWNACFFCGSCAVIRRAALEEIGGFAVETVTEDAHTMLKLHRRGWDSAYLKLPLAGGLATERLIQHIGQRVRWARGMLQILRIDNPLFGPGLTLGQRICYLQATGHFLFAIPRLVFLTAPLAYLLLGQNIIAASPLAITAYALPHIVLSIATNSRLQQGWRHSFWSEIYETVLALFLVRVTIGTLASPHRGKFNVTSKGGLLENGYFDLRAVYPNLILTALLVAGTLRGFLVLFLSDNDMLTFQALLLNTIWAMFSLLTLLAALAVGRETRQTRSRARIRAVVPCTLHTEDGRILAGATRDLSQGGGSLVCEAPVGGMGGTTAIQVGFNLGGDVLLLPARILRWDQQLIQVSWQPLTIEDEMQVVQVVFGRADTWTDWAAYPADRPFVSLWRVLVSILGLFRPPERAPAPRRPDAAQPQAGLGGDDMDAAQPGHARPRRTARAAAVLSVLLAWTGGVAAQPIPGGVTVRPVPGQAPQLQPRPQPAPALPPVVPLPPAAGAVAQTEPPARSPSALPTTSRRLVLSLRQLGALGPLTLRGSSELQGVQFGVRSDEVVTSAQLALSGAMSPAMIPEFSNVTVTLNEQYVGTIPVNRGQPRFDALAMPVSPVFFQDSNRLNFRFTGRYTQECNDPLSGLLWSTISDTSTLTLTLERLPPQRDLARLPLPFFDRREKLPLSLPFVMAPNPSNETLQAAGAVSSWFGQLADFRGATYPAGSEIANEGNAVVFALAGELPAGLALPPINGPTLAVVANPNDPAGSLLVVAGRTGPELVAAATARTFGHRALGGETAAVTMPEAAPRTPYDAPAWIATDRPVKLGELVNAEELQGAGYVPGTLRVPFRTAPDLYTWRNHGFPLNVRYRAPPGPVIDLAVSRLDVGINNLYLDSLRLADDPARRTSWFSRLFDGAAFQPAARVDVPAYTVFGQNDLQFYFDARPLHRGDCVAIPGDLRMSVDPDSTIDLSRAHRFAQLPNLAYFVNSGFPFTRMADLSETAVVVPDRPDPAELRAYLDLMGRIGALTGLPATRVAVVRPDQTGTVADRDLLLVGTLGKLGGAADLLRGTPFRLAGNRIGLDVGDRLEGVRRLFGDRTDDRDRASTALSAAPDESLAALVGGESPLGRGRSVVALLAVSPQALGGAVAALRDSEQAPRIQGDLAILSGGAVTAYRVGDTYTVGRLPPWIYPSWLLRDQPLGIVGIMLAGCFLAGLAFYGALRRKAARRYRQAPGRIGGAG